MANQEDKFRGFHLGLVGPTLFNDLNTQQLKNFIAFLRAALRDNNIRARGDDNALRVIIQTYVNANDLKGSDLNVLFGTEGLKLTGYLSKTAAAKNQMLRDYVNAGGAAAPVPPPAPHAANVQPGPAPQVPPVPPPVVPAPQADGGGANAAPPASGRKNAPAKKDEVKKGTPFENLSNDQLKEFLKILKADVPKSTLVVGGNKGVMAERIKEYMTSNEISKKTVNELIKAFNIEKPGRTVEERKTSVYSYVVGGGNGGNRGGPSGSRGARAAINVTATVVSVNNTQAFLSG